MDPFRNWHKHDERLKNNFRASSACYLHRQRQRHKKRAEQLEIAVVKIWIGDMPEIGAVFSLFAHTSTANVSVRSGASGNVCSLCRVCSIPISFYFRRSATKHIKIFMFDSSNKMKFHSERCEYLLSQVSCVVHSPGVLCFSMGKALKWFFLNLVFISSQFCPCVVRPHQNRDEVFS